MNLMYAALVAALPPVAQPQRPTISYTALSDAARAAGQLARYDSVAVTTRRLSVDGHELTFSIPKTARAYDVVPIRYRLRGHGSLRRAAIEANAFLDPVRAGRKPLYSLAIPGDLGVKIEYLGSVSADFDDDAYIALSADPKTPISPFPPYRRDPMVRSSTIRAAQAVWFKFKVTNTGNTVLDPDGFGASFAQP